MKRPIITKKRAAIIRWTAHAYLTGEAGEFSCYGNGINPAEVEIDFLALNLPWVTGNILFGMAEADLIQVLYSSNGPVVECIATNISAVILNEPSIRWLVAEGYVPANYAGALSDIGAARDAVLEAGQFQNWLKDQYRGPETETPVKTGLPATIAKTSQWVTKLAYTPEEAEAEIAVIERSTLAKGSKAAFKAHVSRRVVA